MNKISDFIEKMVAPFANRLGRQKYVQVIQSAFLTLIPFMAVGSFALILISPAMDYTVMDPGILKSFFEGWAKLSEFAGAPLNAVFMASMGALSLYVAIGIGYYLAKHHKMSTFLPVLLTTVTFILVCGVGLDGGFTTQYFDGTGLFAAIFTSVTTFEFYKFLYEKKIGRIDFGSSGMPPALSESLASLIPVIIVVLVFGLFSAIIVQLTGGLFPGLVGAIMEPIVGMIDNVWGVIFLSILVMVFWWFGIHDSVITGPLSPFLLNNLAANMTAYASGTAAIALPFILTEPFWWTFMTIGGSGATFGLALLCLFSRSKHLKTVGKLGIVPAFFNINEPIIFGLPIMFNPLFFVPFVMAMTANGVITYVLMQLQIVARTFANPTWNMFSPIGALISTMDFKAVVLVLGLIILDILIYLPFFKVYEKQKVKEEAE